MYVGRGGKNQTHSPPECAPLLLYMQIRHPTAAHPYLRSSFGYGSRVERGHPCSTPCRRPPLSRSAWQREHVNTAGNLCQTSKRPHFFHCCAHGCRLGQQQGSGVVFMESQQSKPVSVDFTNPHTDVLFPEGANREGCVFSMHTPERPLLMVPSKRGDQTQRV